MFETRSSFHWSEIAKNDCRCPLRFVRTLDVLDVTSPRYRY